MKPLYVGLMALSCSLAPSGPAHAQVSDTKLGEQVAESVRTYSKFSIFDDIDVSVDDRVVTLLGRVTSTTKKQEIEARIAKVDGVRSVRNEIGVLPTSPFDTRLRNLVADSIYRHQSFWQYAQRSNPPVHIIVEHQHVTLTGEVGSEVDRMLAYSLATQVQGALSITNRIRVARRSPATVRD